MTPNAPKNLSVGDEVDFYCRRCRLNLHGNVASLEGNTVKTVTCRTCRSTQPYVAEKTPEELRSRQLRRAFALRDRRQQQHVETQETRGKAVGGPEVTKRWRAAVEEVDANYAPRYSRHKVYEEGESLIHPKMGLGVVIGIIHENACLVLFRKQEMPLEMGAPDDEYDD